MNACPFGRDVTNAWTALLAGNEAIAARLREAEVICLNAVVLGELLDGFKGGTKEAANRELLKQLRQKPRTVFLPIGEDSSEWFAVIKQQLKRAGKPIPINDVWIAASCLEHGAALLTLDGHFQAVEGLLLVTP
jgi:tRNA(fMet)-specific endonuclease VapC